MQALFYLLQYDKAGIVEEGTQKFFWKTARDKIDDAFLNKMKNYQIMGEKTGEYKPYQTINFIEKLIAEITPEAVDLFDMTAGRLFRWLLLALENRKADIVRRKALIQKERDERDSKIAAAEKRATDRET